MFELWTEALGAFDLDDLDNGVIIEKKDFGFPTVRQVQSPRSNAHGVYDNTTYFGDRVISISGSIIGTAGGGTLSRSEALAAIRAYCLPGDRPQLRFSADGSIYYAYLIVDNQSVPIESITHYKFTMAWRAAPFIQSAPNTGSAGHSGSSSVAATTFDITFDIDLNAGGGDSFSEAVAVTNSGIVPTYPFITVTGPITSPSLNESTTDSSLVFNGLSLLAGETVLVDFEEHTATLDDGTSALEFIDWGESSWWTLPIGNSSVSLTGGSGYDGNTEISVQWSDRYL